MQYSYFEAPIGTLLLVRDEQGLTQLQLPAGKHPQVVDPDWVRDDAAFDDVRVELEEYFAGTRREFTVPLHPAGTAFQQRVWTALRGIGYGETTSYGKIASAVGEPGAARAVGLANGQNPIPIIVPCHRILHADGGLGGYTGGLDKKRSLLAVESGQAPLAGL